MDFTDEQIATLREQVGFPENADAATIVAAVVEGLGERAEDTPPEQTAPARAQVPDGMVLVDAEQWAEVQAGVADGRAARAAQRVQARDNALDAAVRQGKFPQSRRDHYATLWDADPEGTRDLIAALATGTVPVDEQGRDDLNAAEQQKAEGHTDAALDSFAAGFGLTSEELSA